MACGTLPVLAVGAVMPVVQRCQEGAVGRFMIISRGAVITDLLDIGELDVLVQNHGENKYCMEGKKM